jgi:hypothetical protein
MEMARTVADARGAERLEALLVVGESALQARKNGEAERAYATVVDEAPRGSSERFNGLAGVGLTAEAQRERDAAKRAYQEIVGGASDPELVRWAKGRLQNLEARQATPPRDVPKSKPAPRSKPGARS